MPEFWSEERAVAIRKMAETGMPYVEWSGPSRRGRNLTSFCFRDLRPSSLKEALSRADRLDVDIGIDFFGNRLELPLYVGDMSFGALSGNPNIAITKAVTETGAVASIGEGASTPRWRSSATSWCSGRRRGSAWTWPYSGRAWRLT